MRINIIIRTTTAETTALLYFFQFDDIDYFLTIAVGTKGAHQIYIKYFSQESAEAALAKADPRYGTRRSNPPIVPRKYGRLTRYHHVCQRMVIGRYFENHQKVCRWQVG